MKIALYSLNNKVINRLFFIMIAALPFVNKFTKLTVVLFLGAFFRYIYLHKDFILEKNHQLFLLLFVSLIIITNLNAELMIANLKTDMYLFFYISIFYATIYFLQKDILKLSTLIYAIVISMSVYMIDGYFQYNMGYDFLFHNPVVTNGINSVSRNRNIFALASFFYFIVLFYVSFEIKKKPFIIYILLVHAILLILLTLSRQIWLSMILFLIILLIFNYRYFSFKSILYTLGISTIGMIVLSTIPELQDRFCDLQQLESSGRTEFWQLLLSHLKDAPLLGHSFQSPINIEGAKQHFVYAHNLTVDILYAFGLTGFILYIIFIAYFLKILFKCNNKKLKPYLLATFIPIIFIQQQLGGSMLVHKFIGPSIMILLALIVTYCSSDSFIKGKKIK